jgi:hypothetical protein
MLSRSTSSDPASHPPTGGRAGLTGLCLETQTLDRLGERLDQLEGVRGESVSYGDTKHHQSHQVAH